MRLKVLEKVTDPLVTLSPRGEAAALAVCVCFSAICGADGWSPGQRAAGLSLRVTRMMGTGSLRALVNTFLYQNLVKGLCETQLTLLKKQTNKQYGVSLFRPSSSSFLFLFFVCFSAVVNIDW